jgi:hypothetical protein
VLTDEPTADVGSGSAPTTTGAAARAGLDPIKALYVVLLAVTALGAVVRGAYGPVRDVDVWWHILVGRELLAGASVTGVGADWTIAPVDAAAWVTSQPLAEIVLAAAHDAWGPSGLLLLRVVSTVAAVVVLLLTTLRGRPLRAAAWPTILALVMLAAATQERSQQLTFILAPLVGWWVLRLLEDGRVPRWWVVVPLVAVWANVHGGWVLLPAFLALGALGRVLDHGIRDRAARLALLVAVLATAAAAISPSGLANVVTFLRISSAAQLIDEWGPTVPWSPLGVPLVAMGLLVVVSWARAQARVPRSEVLVLVGIALLCLSAWRNATPAMLIAAPLVVPVVARWLGEPQRVEPRPLRAPLVAAGVAGVLLVTAVAGTYTWRQEPLLASTIPTTLLDDLAAASEQAPQRVLPTYNLGGAVLLFGGGPDRVRVAIDGRTDLYGNEWIEHYVNDVVQARDDWRPTVDAMAPTAALLREDERLVEVLLAEGWVEVGREEPFVLLHAPGAPGWS